ncbi:aldo/keto reductase, partial [bacterium]|nr:aldo/keto reductase [bacterium]
MEYRRLGKAGIKVSAIGLGGWLTFGGSVDEERAIDCIHAALDEGIIFFDSADVYAKGESERVMGKALEGVRRSDIVIASKLFGNMSDNPNDRGLCRKHIMESVEKSLERLGTDYLDIFYSHRYDEETPLE